MSNQIDPFSNSLSIQTIQEIDKLNLPIMKKHHVRILAHCLTIIKFISLDKNLSSEENLLREWCNNQSKKFDDKSFSDLFYEQLSSTAKKLSVYSQKIGKDIKDLDIDDLVLLVEKISESN